MEQLQTRIKKVINKLKQLYPQVKCALYHRNAFELLAATILSAQCTDVQVNKVTPHLFKRFPRPEKMAKATLAQLETIVRSTGFYRNKAKSLSGMSMLLVKAYNGTVPDKMVDLLKLPGVARKTANVVLGDAFGKAEGIVVDTHVRRISRLLRLTQEEKPEKIESDLQKLVPHKEWIGFSHRLILLGRETCVARRPKCTICTLQLLCPSAPVLD